MAFEITDFHTHFLLPLIYWALEEGQLVQTISFAHWLIKLLRLCHISVTLSLQKLMHFILFFLLILHNLVQELKVKCIWLLNF